MDFYASASPPAPTRLMSRCDEVKQRDNRGEWMLDRSSEGTEMSLSTASGGYRGESSSMG